MGQKGTGSRIRNTGTKTTFRLGLPDSFFSVFFLYLEPGRAAGDAGETGDDVHRVAAGALRQELIRRSRRHQVTAVKTEK